MWFWWLVSEKLVYSDDFDFVLNKLLSLIVNRAWVRESRECCGGSESKGRHLSSTVRPGRVSWNTQERSKTSRGRLWNDQTYQQRGLCVSCILIILRIYNFFRTQQVSIHIGIEKVKQPILILKSSHTIFSKLKTDYTRAVHELLRQR